MDSRSRFRPRLDVVEAAGDRGTKWERPCGLAVQPCRRGNTPRRECERRGQPQSESCGVDTREKPAGETSRTSVPQTDTGGRGEQPQVNE
jgi:hypothetical protein